MSGTLAISEFSTLPFTTNGVATNWAMCPSIADQQLPIGASSTVSLAFSTSTRFVRLQASGICSVAFGAAGSTPTASANNARMAANASEYFGVQGGGRVAVIQNS